MKVLWLCSTPTPKIAEKIGIKAAVNVSWIVNTLGQLEKIDGINVGICFPVSSVPSVTEGETDGVHYYAFSKQASQMFSYDNKTEKYFEYVLTKFKPDVVHIWGTEYPHTLAMLKACQKLQLLDKAVVSIQGLCSVIAKHYYALLPDNVIKRYTLRDSLKRENIKSQKESFEKRGDYEIEAIKLTKNVIGRTEWDEACTRQINSKVNYHFCNETMRTSFYENQWSAEHCQKHSIFVSQGYYPVKGLHFVIEALAILKDNYPDVMLYVGGLNVTNRGWKISSYGKYLEELIRKYNLKENICFTGMLNEERMCTQYLKANVFVSASTIENSPNSVSEAMLLGMPVVSSDVGGVKNLISHGVDGYIYPCDEVYMLSYYIQKFFEDLELCKRFGNAAKQRALNMYDRNANCERLVEIYRNFNGGI